MSEVLNALARLRRPHLLVRAARHGLADYERGRDLARLLRRPGPPPPEEAVRALIAAEAELEQARTARGARYSAARHVDVLIALMGESSLLAAEAHPVQG